MERVEAKRASFDPVGDDLVGQCHRDQVCKSWKAGGCHRREDCAFQHPPKPAAPSTKDDKRGKSKITRGRRRVIA